MVLYIYMVNNKQIDNHLQISFTLLLVSLSSGPLVRQHPSEAVRPRPSETVRLGLSKSVCPRPSESTVRPSTASVGLSHIALSLSVSATAKMQCH